MSDPPDISIVMSVYNGAADLRRSMDSILSQKGVDFEFVVVNDGSTDHSLKLLEEYASKDHRVRLITQQNQGLTIGLHNGCAAARGEYIARQDVGDVSLPDRLIKQLECIRKNPDSALVSCGTRFVGPEGEHLYEVTREGPDATARLLTLDPAELSGPSSHPSTMFSRRFYERAGGYRAAFYVAQDLDLWIRLAELGRHVVMPEILYEASVTVDSISGLHRKAQVAMTSIILEGAKLRRHGLNEQNILEQAASMRSLARSPGTRLGRARAFYFIGSCLKKRDNRQATYYFRQALKCCPFHLKSAVRLLAG